MRLDAIETETLSLEAIPGRQSPNRKGFAQPNITIRSDGLRGRQRLIGSLTILVPLFGAIAAVLQAVLFGVGAMELWLLGAMFFLTNMGLEFGWHRNLAHRGFKAAAPVKNLFAFLGSLAGTGRILFWIANHRRHHLYSDQAEDPHSPNVRKRADSAEELGFWKGMWHAHFGHILNDDLSNCTLFAKDIAQDRFLIFLNRNYLPLVLLGLAIPAAVGGIVRGNIAGAVSGMLWGGLFRMFLVYQSHWCLASFSHRFGSRPFRTGDKSGNSFFIALVSFGSGWQNNHHAFPTSAYLGLKWWQMDIAAWLVVLLSRFGLIWDVRRPSPMAIQSKLIAKMPRATPFTV